MCSVWSPGSNEAGEFLDLGGAAVSESLHLKTNYSCPWGATGAHRTLGKEAGPVPGQVFPMVPIIILACSPT